MCRIIKSIIRVSPVMFLCALMVAPLFFIPFTDSTRVIESLNNAHNEPQKTVTNFESNELNQKVPESYGRIPSDSPTNSSQHRNSSNYVGGEIIKNYEKVNHTQIDVAALVSDSEMNYYINHSRYRSNVKESHIEFLDEINRYSTAAILGSVGNSISPEDSTYLSDNIFKWVASGKLLLLSDVTLLDSNSRDNFGIHISKVRTSNSQVRFSNDTGLIQNLPRTTLSVSGSLSEFILDDDSIFQPVAYREENSTIVAVFGKIGKGFCLILGFTPDSIEMSTDKSILRSILINAISLYSDYHLTIYTSPMKIDSPLSPHLHPLAENESLMNAFQLISEKFSRVGFNVIFSNLLIADYDGGYFGRLSLTGTLTSVLQTFSTSIDVGFDKTSFIEFSDYIIPSFANQIFVRISPVIKPIFNWPSGWAPPDDLPYYHLAPSAPAVDDMGTDQWSPRSVEEVLKADTARSTFGLTGAGVKVAVIDSGFSANGPGHNIYPTPNGYHPYYEEYYSDLLQNRYTSHQVGTSYPWDDSVIGHGTAIIANLLAVAPGIDLHFIQVDYDLSNPADAFSAALSTDPDVISCSWTSSMQKTELENFVRQASENGIIVVFSTGNGGEIGWTGYEPSVVSVGGTYVNSIGDLYASNYASSGELDSGRMVPDVTGIVGQAEYNGRLIELPTEPDSSVDHFNDDTESDDGWAVISGTSSAAPQVAGLAALVKQYEPNINVGRFKHVVMTTCTDVVTGVSANNHQAVKGFDKATGAGLINVYRTLETMIDYSSSDTYAEKTIPSGKQVNFMEISTPYGPGYHIDTCGTSEYAFYFFGYLTSRDGPIMMTRGGISIGGYFRQYDTFPSALREGRRNLNLYILSVDGSQILKTVRLLDYDDGTNWKLVVADITDIGPLDNWGMVRIAIGRSDGWSADWSLTVEWVADVDVWSSHEPWTPDTTPDGKYYNFGPSTAPEAYMGRTYHLDTIGSSQYAYYFYANSWCVPYLNPYHDIHIAGWFRQYDTFVDPEGRRSVYFYLIHPVSGSVIASKRILEYYDGTDWVYRRIHFKCGFLYGNYYLAIGRDDSWMTDWSLTVEWSNVQIWT